MEKFCRKGHLKRSGKRFLALLLSACLIGTMIPISASAEESSTGTGLCEHHTEHRSECGYVAPTEGHACEHVHDDSCGYQESAECNHVHTEECGEDGENCTHVHNDECGYAEGHECNHVHDDECGYVEASEGSPCTFVCDICGKEAEPEQTTDKLITTWQWIDEEEYLDPETGSLSIPGASEEMPAHFEDVTAFLPTQILATVVNADDSDASETGVGEAISLGDWACDNYPEEGAYSGSYTFTAALPEGCALSEEAKALSVTVELGGAQQFNVTGVNYLSCDEDGKNWTTLTCKSATEVTSEDEAWGTSDTETWYVASGTVTIGSRVTVNGTVHLILADNCNLTINGGIGVTQGNNFTIYAQSDGNQMGCLTIQNVGSGDAGIGGNSSISGKITINGGTISSTGSAGAAIGGGSGYYGIVTINGGVVTASSKNGAGIGNGRQGGNAGGVVINGGVVTASSNSGAGIGGGYGGQGTVTIKGGVITATSTNRSGIGTGSSSSSSSSTVTITGLPVIFASSISDQSGKESDTWGGVIFEGDSGKAYGTSVNVTTDCTIPSGKTLEVSKDQTISIAEAATFTNEGTIYNSGTITGTVANSGTIHNTGTISGASGGTINHYSISIERTESSCQMVELSLKVNDTAFGESVTYTLSDGETNAEIENVNTLKVVDSGFGTPIPVTATFTVDGVSMTRTEDVTITGHVLAYAVNSQTTGTSSIKVTCGDCGKEFGIVTLSAPTMDLTYDGNAKTATVDTSGVTGVTISTPTITYKQGETALTSAPKDAGTYTASITLGTGENAATVSVEFTIAPATPTISWGMLSGTTWVEMTEIPVIYTGSEIAPDKLVPPTITLVNNETYSGEISYSYRAQGSSDAFTSGLPTEIGTYEVKASIAAYGNYKEAASTVTLTVIWLNILNSATLTDQGGIELIGDTWWAQSVTFTAPTGFTISNSLTDSFGTSFVYNEQTGADGTEVTYYLKNSNGEIAKKTATVRVDKTVPDWNGENDGISIKTNKWKSLLSTISFGLFYKETVDVKVCASDSLSGVAAYYYYVDSTGGTVKTAEQLDEISFTKYTDGVSGENPSVTVTSLAPDGNYIVYAYAVDKAGNRSAYVCSEGIVVDSTAPAISNIVAPSIGASTLTDTTAQISFTGSEAGTYFYMVKESSETAPTTITDFATEQANDGYSSWTAKQGVSYAAMTADGSNTVTLTGLEANTKYTLYLAAVDQAGNSIQTIASQTFTTCKTIPTVADADMPKISGTYGQTVADMTLTPGTAKVGNTVITGAWAVTDSSKTDTPSVGTTNTYQVTFIPDNGMYDTVNVQVTPTVEPKPVTVTAENKTKIYGQENPVFTFTVPEGALVGTDTEDVLGVTLSCEATAVSPVKEGGYAITGTSSSANYNVTVTPGTLTIEKADAEITVGTASYNKTFGDADFTLDVTDTNAEANVQYAVTAGDDVVSVSNGTVTILKAGTATITVSLPASTNYNAATPKTITVNVAKKSGYTVADINKSYLYSRDNADTIDLSGYLPSNCGTVTYGDPQTSGTVEYTVSPAVADGKLSYTVKLADSAEATGTIQVTVTTDNYADFTITVNVELIDKTPVSLSGVTCDDRVYNGTAYVYTGTPVWNTADGTAVTGETTVTYQKAGEVLEKAPTDAGSYLAVFTIASDDYVGTSSYSFEITKAEITVAAKDRNIYTGDTVPDLTNPKAGTDYTVTGLCGTDAVSGTVSMSYAEEPDNTKAGTYEIQIQISGLTVPAGGNYTITSTNGTLTITTKPSGGGSTGGSSDSGSSSGGASGGAAGGTGDKPENSDNTTTITNKDGSTTTTTTETDTNGNTVTTTTTVATDGSTTEKVQATDTNAAGKEVAVTTTTKTDADGNVTSVTEKSVIDNIAKDTTATVTVKTDGDGNVTSAKASVTKTSDTGTVSLGSKVLGQITEAAGADTEVRVTMTVKDREGNTKYKVQANADEIIPGETLYIYKLDTKTGKYTMVNAKEYKVTKAGTVTVNMTKKATYELVTAQESKAITKEILATVKPAKSSTSLSEDKKTTFKLSAKLDMDNVKSITYATSKKSIATVSKKGTITAVNAGTATIKAVVTLKNGTKKTIKMTIKVK